MPLLSSLMLSVLVVLVCGRLLLLWFNAGWRWGCHRPKIKSSTSSRQVDSSMAGQCVAGSILLRLGRFVDFCSHDPVLASLGQYGTVLGQYWVSTGSVLGQY